MGGQRVEGGRGKGKGNKLNDQVKVNFRRSQGHGHGFEGSLHMRTIHVYVHGFEGCGHTFAQNCHPGGGRGYCYWVGRYSLCTRMTCMYAHAQGCMYTYVLARGRGVTEWRKWGHA